MLQNCAIMNRYIILTVICLVVVLPQLLIAQSAYIAEIGKTEVTKAEFRNRYELSPHILGDESDNQDSLKLKFLYSLIAEKLWALEAQNEGLDKSANFNFYYLPIEKSLIRDAVFKNEIEDKVEISGNDIAAGISRYTKILEIKGLAEEDSSVMQSLYSRLKSAGSIDSLISLNPELSKFVSSSEVRFGDISDEVIEDSLYRLKSGEFTKPVNSGDEWFIFELEKIKSDISNISEDKLQSEVKNIIRNRRIRNRYNEFYKKYFGGFTLKADENLFIKIADTFYNVISSSQKPIRGTNAENEYYLSENDILKTKDILGTDILQKKFFNTRFGNVKVYDFLSDLTIVDVKFNSTDKHSVRKVLANELKRFMQQETVYLLGIKTGLQHSEKIRSELASWRDNLLAQMYKNSFTKDIIITDAEVENYYNQKLSDSLEIKGLNIETISSPDLDQMKIILDSVNKGESIQKIASELKNRNTIKTDTISDYDNLKIFGKASDIIAGLDAGEIYGPVQTDSGYTLVKVVTAGNIPDSTREEILREKDNIQRRLFNKKLNAMLKDSTIKLANKYGVSIDNNFLYTESYSDVNLFVHKYLGFGGRIAAVPFTTPFYEWYYKWKSNSGENP